MCDWKQLIRFLMVKNGKKNCNSILTPTGDSAHARYATARKLRDDTLPTTMWIGIGK